MKKLLILRLLILLVIGASLANLARAWWVNGHATLVEAAAFALPDDMPEFFRKAGKALGHFVGDPDRWKNPSAKFLRAGTSADHFLDLEDVEGKDLPSDRYQAIELLQSIKKRPEKSVCFLMQSWKTTNALLVPFMISGKTQRTKPFVGSAYYMQG